MISLKLGSIKYVVIFVVAFSIVLSATFIKSEEIGFATYTDVDSTSWYSEAVTSLSDIGVIPSGTSLFYPDTPASRQDMILYLYNLAFLDKETDGEDYQDVPFEDVDKESIYYTPICWAYENGIVSGYSEEKFNPVGQCSRQELCTMAMRYLTFGGIKPKQIGTLDPFWDIMTVGDFARSYVVASKLAGFVNGDENGNFRPVDAVTRAELAKVIYEMYKSSQNPLKDGEEFVDTTYGAYDWCYPEYEILVKQHNHKAYVEWGASVDVSYFDDAVFVGDSVSMSLQFYCASTKGLGNAKFLCAGSLSPLNAHWELSNESKHPVYMGEKLLVEDAVAKTGAKKVYIMLGVNSISFGVDDCVNDMVSLVEKIEAKSPDSVIILQSVTPMTADSPIKSSTLNNTVIADYNARMLEIAQQRGWYYLDVAEAVKDENGNLRKGYCSDPQAMGIHFNFEADKMWVNYLKSHTPKI